MRPRCLRPCLHRSPDRRPTKAAPWSPRFGLVAILALAPPFSGRTMAADPTPNEGGGRDDEARVIVRFREGSNTTPSEPTPGSPGPSAGSPEFRALLARRGIERAVPLVPPRGRGKGGAPGSGRRDPQRALIEHLRARLERYALVRAPRGVDAATLAAELDRLPEVELAEPDGFAKQAGSTDLASIPPNDPEFVVHQWGFRNTGDQLTDPPGLPRKVGADIRAVEGWAATTGDPAVVVAVLDTGIRTDHPEFAGRIWSNEAEIPGNGIDDDSNGYVDDVAGYNFVARNPNPYDDGGHGTACASILGANANNRSMLAGLDWSCRLMPLKVLSGGGLGSLAAIGQAIVYAADNGADVVSMSLGGDGLSTFLRDACAYAHDSGVFLVAAMMNENSSEPAYPAAFDATVIAVGSTDPADQRCTPDVSGYGSNYGPHIDVVAPGVSIPVLAVGAPTGVTLGGGTSFATPMVAGLGALILAARPDVTPDQVRDLIRHSAADLAGRPNEDTPGFDVYHGWGRIDCGRALALAATTGFPTVQAPASARGVEGALLEFDVSASDPDGDSIDSLVIDGGGALPGGAVFTVSPDHTRGRFTWTPSYSEAGRYTVAFRAANPFEGAAVVSVEILDVAGPPVVTVPSTQVGDEGQPLGAVIAASDPDGDPITSFECGTLPAGATFVADPSRTRGVFAWTPGHAQAGTYVLRFTVESLDPAGPLGEPLVERGSAFLRVVIREGPDQPPVVEAPARLDGAEGAALAADVAVSDADADPVTALAASPLPAGATFAVSAGNTSGRFAWTPGFQQAGVYEIRLSAASAHRAEGVSDPVTTEAGAALTVTVADTPRAPSANPGGPYAGVVEVPIEFDGSASSDPDGTPLATYRWDFGDGATGAGATPSHAYHAGGAYAVSLTVSDGALEGTAETVATVSERFAARAFSDPQDRSIRLQSAKPSACIHVEAVEGSYSAESVDLAGLTLLSSGTGDVDRIVAVGGKGAPLTDADRNGIPDLRACFAKEDLRRLFSGLAAGRNRVAAVVEAPLTTGGRLHAPIDLDVLASGRVLAASLGPNPVRVGGILTVRSDGRDPIRLRLFDVGGRLLREWSALPGPAGYLDLPVDGRDGAGRALPSGVYFYRLESGRSTATGRLALIR